MPDPASDSPTIDMTGWSDAQRVEYAAALAALSEETLALDEELAADTALAASPGALVAELRAEAEAKRIARLRLVREREDDALYEVLSKKHGGERRISRLITELGSVFLRAPTRPEYDEMSARISDLSEADRVAVVKEYVLETLLAPPRPVVEAMLADYGGLWAPLLEAHGELVNLEAEVVKKKGTRSPRKPSKTRP